MIDTLRDKLLDIEAKISNGLVLENFSDYQEVGLEAFNGPSNELNTGTIARHSRLSRFNTSVIRFPSEIKDLQDIILDFDRLSVFFHNTKEVQLNFLKERFEVLALRKNALASLQTGIRLGILPLNEKKILKLSDTYEVLQQGLTFPLASAPTKATPAIVTFVADSNIKIGNILNPLQSSRKEAMFSSDQNDLFSVYREDQADLVFAFNILFDRNEIVNEIEFEVIPKTGQRLTLLLTDKVTGEVLYGDAYQKLILFEQPRYLKEVSIKVTATAIQVNQIDIKELSFYKRQYAKELTVETVPMPSFSNKFLTLEKVELASDMQKDILDFSVKVNGKVLNSLASEQQVQGPFRDPSFTISCKIKDTKSLIKYLGKPKYKILMASDSPTETRTFIKPFTSTTVNLVQARDTAVDVFLPLPIEGMESFIDVALNGVNCRRALLGETLSTKQYYIEYTGAGYTIQFPSLVAQDMVKVKINSLPSYMEKNKIFFPKLGLGTSATIFYATNIKKKRVRSFNYENNFINLNQQNIQRVAFIDITNNEINSLVEKPLHSTLNNTEYAVDYKAGLVYLGVAFLGEIEVTYFETNMVNNLFDTEEREATLPGDIQVFEYNGPLAGLAMDSSKVNGNPIFGFQRSNRISTKIDPTLTIVQLAKFMTLHKGTISLYDSTSSKKEVPYIDGHTELYGKNIEYDFYDYLKTESGWHFYCLRSGNFATPISDCNLVFESSFMIERKEFTTTLSDTLVNDGDYFLNTNTYQYPKGTLLYVKNAGFPNIPATSIRVKIEKNTSEDLFSVNYMSNTIHTKRLSGVGGSISFKYSTVYLEDFTIAFEVLDKKELEPNEYKVFVYNKEDIEALIPYYTPLIKTVSIGIIG